MRQIPQDRAIRVAISEHEALKAREASEKARWDHEKRRSVYAFHAPLCVFCSEHRVGFWETATGADYDEWCGQCEIKPTDINVEVYGLRRVALVHPRFAKECAEQITALKPYIDGITRARSGFRGVYERSSGVKRWQARIRGKSLGYYATPEEAARAYDAAAVHQLGERAILNIPDASA